MATLETSSATAERARLSLGSSSEAIYQMVSRTLASRHSGGGTLIDVGCGSGKLYDFVGERFDRYIGVDVVRYDGFPEESEFIEIDLDSGTTSLADGSGDVVVAVETIEHLENPRAFARELTRLCQAGGWVVITTPNQLSLLSKLTLVVKNQFNAFTDTDYPAHITALLEADLYRIGLECGLQELQTIFTQRGRIPGTRSHYPMWLSKHCSRALSDNLLLVGRKIG